MGAWKHALVFMLMNESNHGDAKDHLEHVDDDLSSSGEKMDTDAGAPTPDAGAPTPPQKKKKKKKTTTTTSAPRAKRLRTDQERQECEEPPHLDPESPPTKKKAVFPSMKQRLGVMEAARAEAEKSDAPRKLTGADKTLIARAIVSVEGNYGKMLNNKDWIGLKNRTPPPPPPHTPLFRYSPVADSARGNPSGQPRDCQRGPHRQEEPPDAPSDYDRIDQDVQ